MEKFIPEHIDPHRYAEQHLRLDGVVKIAEMQRLSTAVNTSNKNDLVTVNLEFGVDEQKIIFIRGQVKTKVLLQCQRCMEPFVCEIMSNFVLGVVNNLDEAKSLPEHYEPALTQEGHLALRELIEDEIILNLPLIPRHEPEDCKVKLPLKDADWKKSDKENPFRVLESLKGKKGS